MRILIPLLVILSLISAGCDNQTKGSYSASSTSSSNTSSPWLTVGSDIYYNTGNVGIGTATPGEKLTVNGTVESKGGLLFTEGPSATHNLMFVGSSSAGSVDASLGFMVAGKGSAGEPDGPYFLGRGNLFSEIVGQRGNMYFSAGTPIGPSADEGSLNFWTNGSSRLVINRTGNVGIGTTSPLDKLDVEGNLNLGSDTNGAYSYRFNNRSDYGLYKPTNSFNLVLSGLEDVRINLDSNNNGTGHVFSIAHDGNLESGGNELFRVQDDGKVGIGTTAPTTELHVRKDQTSITTINVENQSAGVASAALSAVSNSTAIALEALSNNWGIMSRIRTPGDFGIAVNGSYALFIEHNSNGLSVGDYGRNQVISPTDGLVVSGNVGIGTSSPGYKLDVNGDVNIAAASILRFGGNQICTNAGCSTPSDERLKENIKPLQNSLDKILKVRGVEYDYKDKLKFTSQHQIGLIAQDIEKVFPEVVLNDSKTTLKSVAYDRLVAPIIEAVKALSHRIHHTETEQKKISDLEIQLDTKIKNLEQENAELKIRLNKVEKALSSKQLGL